MPPAARGEYHLFGFYEDFREYPAIAIAIAIAIASDSLFYL